MLDEVEEFAAKPLPRKILFFDEMLTPSLIRLAYWLGLLSVAWIGLKNVFTNGFFGIFETIVFVAISVVGLRVLAEIITLFFKMQEDLAVIAKNSEAAVVAAAESVAKTPDPVAKPVAKKKTKKKASKKVSKKATKKTAGD